MFHTVGSPLGETVPRRLLSLIRVIGAATDPDDVLNALHNAVAPALNLCAVWPMGSAEEIISFKDVLYHQNIPVAFRSAAQIRMAQLGAVAVHIFGSEAVNPANGRRSLGFRFYAGSWHAGWAVLPAWQLDGAVLGRSRAKPEVSALSREPHDVGCRNEHRCFSFKGNDDQNELARTGAAFTARSDGVAAFEPRRRRSDNWRVARSLRDLRAHLSRPSAEEA